MHCFSLLVRFPFVNWQQYITADPQVLVGKSIIKGNYWEGNLESTDAISSNYSVTLRLRFVIKFP